MTNMTTELSQGAETALQPVTPGITIGALKALIVRLRRGNPKVSYENIGAAFGVNRGIIWKMVNLPGYVPSRKIRKRLRITGRKRVRIIAQVDPETKAAVHAAAEGMGLTEAEWLRRQVSMGLFTGALMAAAKVEARIAEKLREVLEVEGER